MGSQAIFPQTTREVLAVIIAAERSRKYVWTAGRVLIQGALQVQWEELDAIEKKAVLRKIAKLLEELADQSVLEPRPILQSIGYGAEKGFDYIRPAGNLN
jgi:hypothetical protein